MDFLRHWQTAAGANQGTRVNVTLASGPLVSDPLTTVTDGLGAVTTVSYKKLGDPTVYSKGAAATFPDLTVQTPSCLVSQVTVPNGTGGTRSTSYFYTQARVHLQGRGFLGFATMAATDDGGDGTSTGDVKTTTTYSQSFPTIGQVTRTEQRVVSTNNLITETDNTYTNVTTATSSVTNQAPAKFAYVSNAVAFALLFLGMLAPSHRVVRRTGDRRTRRRGRFLWQRTRTKYCYDKNGNQTTGDGRTLTWASYDLPTKIEKDASFKREFDYDADRARYKQVLTNAGTVTTTHYVADSLFEKVAVTGVDTAHRFNIYANDQRVAVVVDNTTAADETRYLHRDHLGSVSYINRSSGTPERQSYDPYGRRRNATTWADATTTSIEPRGYTDHEQLDALGTNDVGLIHMNGRLQDPKLGRMLSADPLVTDASDSQDWNAYSYVRNNPTRFVDPSGYSYSSDSVGSLDGPTFTPGFLSAIPGSRNLVPDYLINALLRSSGRLVPGGIDYSNFGPLTLQGHFTVRRMIAFEFARLGGADIFDLNFEVLLGAPQALGNLMFLIPLFLTYDPVVNRPHGYTFLCQPTGNCTSPNTTPVVSQPVSVPAVGALPNRATSLFGPSFVPTIALRAFEITPGTPPGAYDVGIQYSNGAIEIRSGSVPAWRNNNPGNLRN